VSVKISSKPIEEGTLLKKVSDGANEVVKGATYESERSSVVWLCPVTQFVLGGSSKYISIEVEHLA
jgi:hypothetical protein